MFPEESPLSKTPSQVMDELREMLSGKERQHDPDHANDCPVAFRGSDDEDCTCVALSPRKKG